jgi:hypothetical protein
VALQRFLILEALWRKNDVQRRKKPKDVIVQALETFHRKSTKTIKLFKE